MSECPENGQNLIEEVQKYKDWNWTVYIWLMKSLLTKKIQFEEEKSKIKCLWTQLNFIVDLIEEGFDCDKKNLFLSQFRL